MTDIDKVMVRIGEALSGAQATAKALRAQYADVAFEQFALGDRARDSVHQLARLGDLITRADARISFLESAQIGAFARRDAARKGAA
jgi:hypothetical protein